MTSWQDVASKGIDFLQKPNAMGFGIILLVVALLIYVVPIGATIYAYTYNTDRVVAAIKELTKDCQRTVAMEHKP